MRILFFHLRSFFWNNWLFISITLLLVLVNTGKVLYVYRKSLSMPELLKIRKRYLLWYIARKHILRTIVFLAVIFGVFRLGEFAGILPGPESRWRLSDDRSFVSTIALLIGFITFTLSVTIMPERPYRKPKSPLEKNEAEKFKKWLEKKTDT